MKNLFLTGAFACAVTLAASGCASETNVSVNANRAGANTNSSNSNSSMMNSAMNTMGNAANTMSNSASNMMGSSAESPNAFLTAAAQGGMAEVAMGKLASQKAQNPEVKKFGQMMVTDHTAANNELKALATKKNVQIPSDVDSAHKSDMDSMSKLTGAEFDKEYVEMMVDDHEEDVAKFQKQADSATDADVKAFAMKTLPTLKKHLETIKGIHAKMK